MIGYAGNFYYMTTDFTGTNTQRAQLMSTQTLDIVTKWPAHGMFTGETDPSDANRKIAYFFLRLNNGNNIFTNDDNSQ